MSLSTIKRTWFVVAVFMGFFVVQSQSYANETTLSNTRQAELSHMVKQDCGSCHGMTLKGGLGPALLEENLQNLSLIHI